MNETVKFQDILLGFRAVLKKAAIVLCISLLAFLAGILLTLKNIHNTYGATATVYSATYGSYEQSMKGAIAMQGYADIITSSKVCESALELMGDDRLNIQEIREMIRVDEEKQEESAVLSISAVSEDHNLAVRAANAVAEAFAMEIGNITGENTIRVLDEADSYKIDVNGRQRQWMIRLLCMAAGFLLSGSIIFLMEFFSNRLKVVEQCTLDGAIDILGIIPKLNQEEE